MFDDLRDLYQEVILDHGRKPRNFRRLEGASHVARGDNPLCGDRITMMLAIDGDAVREVAFTGRGCAISQAATSMLTEMVKGRGASEVAVLEREELLEEVGIPLTPVRLKCAILGLHTLKVALSKAKGVELADDDGDIDVR